MAELQTRYNRAEEAKQRGFEVRAIVDSDCTVKYALMRTRPGGVFLHWPETGVYDTIDHAFDEVDRLWNGPPR